MKQWIITGASILGQSHEEGQTVCQDAYNTKLLDEGWGIACLCDGAGSYDTAQLGSRFTSQRALDQLEKLVLESDWISEGTLPDPAVWQDQSLALFKQLRRDLQEYAEELEKDLMELSCTLIVVIYHADGLCLAHVGDGRAAYAQSDGEWKACMTPFEGEVAGSTVFLSQDLWLHDPETYFESRVIREKICGFSLMSDGMEAASFHTKSWDQESEQMTYLNLPDQGFFQSLTNTILKLVKEHKTPDQIKARWVSFLENGNDVLRHEPDDKTVILGLYADHE